MPHHSGRRRKNRCYGGAWGLFHAIEAWLFSRRKRRLCIFPRSEEYTSELQSRQYLVCRLLLEKKKFTTLPAGEGAHSASLCTATGADTSRSAAAANPLLPLHDHQLAYITIGFFFFF